MRSFATRRMWVREVDDSEDPAEFVALFNSRPDALDAMASHTGVRHWQVDDAALFLWQSSRMENSHCLYARRDDGRLVATAALLVPHPVEAQPWIGLLLAAGDPVGDPAGGPSGDPPAGPSGGWAAELLAGIEAELAAGGWAGVFASPLADVPGDVAFWRECGYVEVDRRRDTAKRPVLVHWHDLRVTGARSDP